METQINILVLIVAILGLLWFFIPIFSGIPWVPTDGQRIHKALRLAQLEPGETMVDLGCGDGRVLVTAAKAFGARAVGIEISPLHCIVAWIRIQLAGFGKQVSVHWKSYYQTRLSEADVVYYYGHSRSADKLKQYLENQLHNGTRVVSISVDFPGWQPEKVDKENLIFVYRMPPAPGDVASFLLQEAVK